MSIHDEHRARVRKRFLEEGLENFSDVQVLELLLFYVIPRQDTNPIAHRLLSHFGSLSQLLQAPVSELKKVEGIGESAATYLRLIMETIRYFRVEEASRAVKLTTVDDCAQYLVPRFLGHRNEVVLLLCLDSKCKVICCKQVGEGSVNSAGVSTRKIVETALAANASSVVLAHNHPSGLALPSSEDIQTTRRIAVALKAVDVVLVDHIIVADGDHVSLAQSGYSFDNCVVI